MRDEGIAKPILLGDKTKINKIAADNFMELSDMTIIDPLTENRDKRNEFGDMLWQRRQRRGLTQFDARKLMRDRNYFGAMMVETGLADAMISGLTRKYGQPIKPALEIIDTLPGVSKVAGLYIVVTKGPFFFADTTMNVDPTAEELADIAVLTANTVKQYNITPSMAML